MAYYFLSANPTSLDEFQIRMPLLAGAKVLNSRKALEKELDNPSVDSFYFIPFNERNHLDELVILIKARNHTAKIIYLTEDATAQDLKSHQLSYAGGDAYLHQETKTNDLKSILEGFTKTQITASVNRLEQIESPEFSELEVLKTMKEYSLSQELDRTFKHAIKVKTNKPKWQSSNELLEPESTETGDPMSSKDQDLSLDDNDDLEIILGDDVQDTAPLEEGLDLTMDTNTSLELGDDINFDAKGEESKEESNDGILLSDDDVDESFTLEEAEAIENIGELSFEEDATRVASDLLVEEDQVLGDLSLNEDVPDFNVNLGTDLDEDSEGLSLSDDDLSLDMEEDLLSLGGEGEADLSEDAKEKLKEIDAIMDYDASQISIENNLSAAEESEDSQEVDSDRVDNLDKPLVSEDLDLDSLNFSGEDLQDGETIIAEIPKEEKSKKKKSKDFPKDRNYGEDLKEISGAYSGEMERMQATISNLRSDREELLNKIQTLEEDKLLHSRQSLTLRAELDEKKIELTIIRKKLSEEISELKDRLKFFDEKRLIIEEKNRLLSQELDKSAQKNRIDVKKVQMRERELEQKLELLKADAETQIRNRDLKILELKRKMDAMEFDMESISTQEKRSVESRFELEDKLDKAIKTLRSAITVLEDESDRGQALDALKKNIDM